MNEPHDVNIHDIINLVEFMSHITKEKKKQTKFQKPKGTLINQNKKEIQTNKYFLKMSILSFHVRLGFYDWFQSQSNEPMVTKDSTKNGPFMVILIFS